MPDEIENLTKWLTPDKGILGLFLERSTTNSRLENGYSSHPSDQLSNKQNGTGVRKVSTGNGHGPPLVNGSNHTSSKSNGNDQLHSSGLNSSSCSDSPEGKSSISKSNFDSDQSSSSNYIVIFGAILAMAAVGIVSAQDWLSFLTIAAQLGLIGLLILAYVHRKWLVVAIKTIPRDLKGGYRYGQVVFHVKRAQRNNWTVTKIFQTNVQKHPDKVCFYFEDEVWTFRDVDEMSNRVGNYFASLGLKKGDTVSLFMENRPEYVCFWLGLCKIGVVPALINFNLRLGPLTHSITVSESKLVIYGYELTSAMQDILGDKGMDKIPLYCTGAEKENILPDAISLDVVLQTASTTLPVPSEPINFTDKLLYIYTSGTTGLPKAAVIKHSRFVFFTMGIHYFVGVSHDEVIYDPLPLYHTAGGMLGVGLAVMFGSTAVLRKKFSASSYWRDCARYNCTAAQYIGEICRYLLSQPPSADDTKHKVHLMFGNGLRPQIWADFAKRFNIKTISEFYGATEGNCNIVNIDNHIGAVGFISRILPFIYPLTLIKVDELSGEPIRDPRTGLVLRCQPNEDGELVGTIVENHPVREFQGYADATATNKKIVRDVFRKGDAAFRTGDVLMMDDYGYFYFKDRTGDTFRWKGENVSTSEVEAVVSNVCGLRDAVVYGVEIPKSEGRAGMAAVLDVDETLDMDAFEVGVTKSLPSYARPLFVRIIKQMDMTGTYKMKKLDLQKEAYDVTKVSDKIYVLNKGKYTVVDNELYTNIMSGQMRL